MRVVEEPFVTRDSVLSVLKPGEVTSESPFRTLRSHGSASPGLSIQMRSAGGRVMGTLQLYSVLNTDAARAYRLNKHELAQALADRAAEIERSDAASTIRDAIAGIAGHVPLDLSSGDAPLGLRRYVALQRRCSWRALDASALAREWLTRSVAWLDDATRHDDLVNAVIQLERLSTQARADVLADEARSVTTFFGIVKRMDHVAAEVVGTDESVLVPRTDLERQGLAVLDQAVALLHEQLPGGGSYLLPLAAIALDEPTAPVAHSPWDPTLLSDGGFPGSVLAPDDARWLDRELAREPNSKPLAPLPIA